MARDTAVISVVKSASWLVSVVDWMFCLARAKVMRSLAAIGRVLSAVGWDESSSPTDLLKNLVGLEDSSHPTFQMRVAQRNFESLIGVRFNVSMADGGAASRSVDLNSKTLVHRCLPL